MQTRPILIRVAAWGRRRSSGNGMTPKLNKRVLQPSRSEPPPPISKFDFAVLYPWYPKLWALPRCAHLSLSLATLSGIVWVDKSMFNTEHLHVYLLSTKKR